MRDESMQVKPMYMLALGLLLLVSSFASAEELSLHGLIQEALKKNPDILASQARASAAEYRIPQASSLPDPMFMFGYQNEGFKKYTYGEMPDAQWMFSASQMFFFPGKRALKGEMAGKEAESIAASHEAIKLRIIARIKELYFDLFLVYKDIDLLHDRAVLFSRIEDAALARYSSGMAPQQEVIMAQTEKYMLLEKEEMLKQKLQSIEAMLNTTEGRDVISPLGRPSDPTFTAYAQSIEELRNTAYEKSPEIKTREKMIASAEAKVQMAEKEYYPDFTLTGSFFSRRGPFEDMVSLTTTVNLPIYYNTKQSKGVQEAVSSLSEARHELAGIKFMLSSSIRDNYSMVKAAEKLMELYRDGLIPKTYQDFELAISGYVTGKVEAITVISRLKTLLDLELSYWRQFVEREKAIARLESITGMADSGPGVPEK